MQNIESEFHNLLEDVAPSVHTKDEQARIIAEASAIFTKMSSRRLAKRNSNPRLVEAQMTDAILQAMGSIAKWDDEYDYSIVEASGLTNNQILRQASKTKWGVNDVINPGFLDITTADEEDPELFDFENGDNQDPAAFTDKPKHRSDFQSSPSR
jgi:hypothetical protein